MVAEHDEYAISTEVSEPRTFDIRTVDIQNQALLGMNNCSENERVEFIFVPI